MHTLKPDIIPSFRKEMSTKSPLSQVDVCKGQLLRYGKLVFNSMTLCISTILESKTQVQQYQANTNWTLIFYCFFCFIIFKRKIMKLHGLGGEGVPGRHQRTYIVQNSQKHNIKRKQSQTSHTQNCIFICIFICNIHKLPTMQYQSAKMFNTKMLQTA